MDCVTKFNDFISGISLTDEMKQALREAYKQLKANLNSDEISKYIVGMFLQGSFARSTGVRPINKDDKLDVDLVVVTRFDYHKVTPREALDAFIPFLNKYYRGQYRMQGRSIGINIGNCSVDLVPTALPSKTVEFFVTEAFNTDEYADKFFRADSVTNAIKKYAKQDDSWKKEPLKIPDREAGKWDDTHPMAQILWTQDKNANTNGEYIRLVRALKWWKKNFCKNAESVKSYPLEHFIGYCCPSEKKNLASLLVDTLSQMASFNAERKPVLPDHGVPQHDVFGRVDGGDYKNFINQIKNISKKAKEALIEPDNYESSVKWRDIFGEKFPLYEKPTPKLTKREEPSTPTKPTRYA